jgi:hypothetical protein
MITKATFLYYVECPTLYFRGFSSEKNKMVKNKKVALDIFKQFSFNLEFSELS